MSHVGGENNSMSAKVVQSKESIACCHLPALPISAQNQTLLSLGLSTVVRFDKPFLVRLLEYKYLWKLLSRRLSLLKHSEQQQLLL